MQEKPFERITIKELCERADVNRTTFYLHYADQRSVLNDIKEDTKQKTLAIMQGVKLFPNLTTLYCDKNQFINR